MAGLKQLYKARDKAIKTEAISAATLQSLQEDMALHAPYQHQMTYDLMPEDVKSQFETMGRGNDSEIRKIDGKPAHVTPGEATLLDGLGKPVESLIKKIGSGTTNPKTGLKEYDWSWSVDHMGRHTAYELGLGPDPHRSDSEGSSGDDDDDNEEITDEMAEDWEELSDLHDKIEGISKYDISYGDTQQYFGDIYDDKPKKFAKKKAKLARKQLGLEKEGFQMKQAGEVRGIMSQSDKMKSQSGFATSGTIDFSTEQARQESAQTTQLGLEGFRLDRKGIKLDLKQSLYDIKTSQDDRFYDRLGAWEAGQD